MKRFITAALVATAMSAPALAEKSVTVVVPKPEAGKAAAEAYTTDLLVAINQVCRNETGPFVGLAYYTFRDCVAETRADVVEKDPTGLLAARLGLPTSVEVAGK